jgi:hypothetical protein
MEELKIICIAISLVWTLDQMFLTARLSKTPNFIEGVLLFGDFKPFNCSFCMSFWVGLFLSIWFSDGLYLTLPIHFRILNVIINRI